MIGIKVRGLFCLYVAIFHGFDLKICTGICYGLDCRIASYKAIFTFYHSRYPTDQCPQEEDPL